MSQVEFEGKIIPEPNGQLGGTEPTDTSDGEEIETKEMDSETKARLRSFYNQSGTIPLKAVEAKPPATQSQE